MLCHGIEHSANSNCHYAILVFICSLIVEHSANYTDMESTNFGYSTKNIPLPSKQEYCRKLIEKTEHLCRRMRWKAHFYLNPEAKGQEKETYGFKSRLTPPQIPEMITFENRLTNMIQNIKFRNINCEFQKKLASDIKTKLKDSNKLLIPADKTTNFYQMSADAYKELLHNNITKTYKHISHDSAAEIESESKSIAKRLQLEDRINTTAKREAFITMKDHKPNFRDNPTCRLINPTKSEIGKVSKQILDRINRKITAKLDLNQWKNTGDVLKWFKNIENKQKNTFIIFDIVDFYPSITADLLNAALDFAQQYDKITDAERNIILHSKQSCLYSEKQPWGKKTTTNLFDVTMGSFDGAETCELVGSFLLSRIETKHGKGFGLYRDDGLGITKATPRQAERIKKDLCAIFKEHGLKITIEANKKTADYLDVTLNLNNGKHGPYTKPNNTPLYVHSRSNHPPNIIKNIPEAINKRLADISHDDDTFEKSTPQYQEALDKSGYKHKLLFTTTTTTTQRNSNTTKRKRNRQITWYNPPYSKNVATNIGQQFLKILREEFPPHNILHKIFNKNTVKISYSCMNNIKQSIDGHNKSIIQKTTNSTPQKKCNCRKPDDCPMSGNCLQKCIIYQATITTDDNQPPQTYVGLTENTFKTRYNNHTASFRNPNKKHSTELSKLIWELKDKGTNYNITWKTIKRTKSYNPASNKCDLCLWEKYFLIREPKSSTINSRNELVTACRHSRKYLLQQFQPSKAADT